MCNLALGKISYVRVQDVLRSAQGRDISCTTTLHHISHPASYAPGVMCGYPFPTSLCTRAVSRAQRASRISHPGSRGVHYTHGRRYVWVSLSPLDPAHVQHLAPGEPHASHTQTGRTHLAPDPAPRRGPKPEGLSPEG